MRTCFCGGILHLRITNKNNKGNKMENKMRKLKKYRVLLSTLCREQVLVEAESELEASFRAVEGHHLEVEESDVIECHVTREPEQISQEPYTTEETLDFIKDHCVQWDTIGFPSDEDARVVFHNHENSTKYCEYPYDNRNSVIEGIWFIMDMHHKHADPSTKEGKKKNPRITHA